MTIEQAYLAVVNEPTWRPKGYGRQTILNMRHRANAGDLPGVATMSKVLKQAGWRITTAEQWARNNRDK